MVEHNKINARVVSRLLAAQLIYERGFSKEKNINEMMEKHLEDCREFLKEEDEDNILAPDRGFFTKLVLKCLEEKESIHAHIAQSLAVGWTVEKLDPLLLGIISLGVSELMFFGDVPTKVVLDQYVTLTKDFYRSEEVNFVNGILHNIAAKVRE